MQSACDRRCPWCGQPLALVWVHGHGQCVRCGTNLEECCRGETAEVVGAPAPVTSSAAVRLQERG
ncbi:hypothetical protein [Nannocystis sp. SCPEA4]|uniref:hypothetical protein n=1 Tax=Nannocystis sp. SCPEA4 TaxID=2996787 RepID=UPI0022709B8F|nr:hypothetical protein [Nannocystis sp. SCPEA4]MCY1062912.1 hypothetical protein [Nannocystis sp. SCPEA4]